MSKEEKSKTSVISVSMPNELYDKLREYAEQKDRSKGSVMRTGLKLLLEEENRK